MLCSRTRPTAHIHVAKTPDSGFLSLPSELIECILRFVAVPSALDEGCSYPEAPWIEATQACRRLRHVALDCALLWTNIQSDMGPDWVHAFFERSECSAPLTYVDCFSTMDTNSENYLALSQQMHRVREMHLACVYVVNEGALDAVLSTPAPFLERCSVYVASSSLPLRDLGLFGNHAPRLQQLSMSFEAGFPWHSPVLDNLVRFEITSGPLVSLTNTSTTDVLEALARMHKLKHLSLKVSLRLTEWSGPPVALNRLRYLYVMK